MSRWTSQLSTPEMASHVTLISEYLPTFLQYKLFASILSSSSENMQNLQELRHDCVCGDRALILRKTALVKIDKLQKGCAVRSIKTIEAG